MRSVIYAEPPYFNENPMKIKVEDNNTFQFKLKTYSFYHAANSHYGLCSCLCDPDCLWNYLFTHTNSHIFFYSFSVDQVQVSQTAVRFYSKSNWYPTLLTFYRYADFLGALDAVIHANEITKINEGIAIHGVYSRKSVSQ